MAMEVHNDVEIERFGRKHPDARRPLEIWLALARQAAWSSIDIVRKTFPSADGIRLKRAGGRFLVVTVFNIGGNKYRLLTQINYATNIVWVQKVMTHAEYDKQKWK